MNIENTIHYLLKRFKTLDCQCIAEKLDVITVYGALPEKLRGFFQVVTRCIVIYLSDDLSEQEKQTVFAHELAHAILHRGMNRIFMDSRFLNVADRYENEASLLAAYMLISDDDIEEYMEHEYTLEQISIITGIETVFIEKRIQGYLKQ